MIKRLAVYAVLIVIGFTGARALAGAVVENKLFMPIVFGSGGYPTVEPTATLTPTKKPTATIEPPTPVPTPTPTLIYAEGGYDWIYVGRAEVVGDGVEVLGMKPGFCYEVQVDRIEWDGTLLVLKAQKILEGTYWCTEEYWHGTYPPPEYPPPTVLPPDYLEGEVYKWVGDRTFKTVCGYCSTCEFGTLNCIEVKR